jgi:hypothetical protein
MVQLTDLYHLMARVGNLDKYDHQSLMVDYRTDGVVDRIETDINMKFKDVQCATALKVLGRYYRKFDSIDEGTQIE